MSLNWKIIDSRCVYVCIHTCPYTQHLFLWQGTEIKNWVKHFTDFLKSPIQDTYRVLAFVLTAHVIIQVFPSLLRWNKISYGSRDQKRLRV